MKVTGSFFLLLCFSVLFSFCKESNVDSKQVRTVNEIVYSLEFYTKAQLEKIDKEIEQADLLYYKLVISENDKASMRIAELYQQKNYNQLLYYVNQNIQGDFKIIVNGKVSNPVQVFFENNNRITKRLVFLIAFEKPVDQTGDAVVEFDDNIFNNGKIKFKYDLKELI